MDNTSTVLRARLIISSLAVASALMMASTANGQPHEPHSADAKHESPHSPKAEKMIQRLDQDGDQRISFEEFKMPNKGNDRLKAMDADGDGNLSRAEMAAELAEKSGRDAEHATRRFDAGDLNKDGVITPQEGRQAAFTKMDVNGDGYVSVDELANRPANKGRRDKARHDSETDHSDV